MAQRAVFLDRDNTIIDDPGYLNDPDAVRLLPGAADAIRRLNDAGYAVVVATNQSGVARGRITERQLADVHERVRELLLEQGARLDAIYYCPYLAGVEASVPRFRKDSALRKPKPGMLLRAASEMDLALPASWMVGDSARDVQAGRRAGCRTVLLTGGEHAAPTADCRPDYTASRLTDAVDIILSKPADDATPPPADGPEESDPPEPGSREDPATVDAGTLGEILDVLRKMQRDQRQDDFSVARLLATLAQMLALAAGAWGLGGAGRGRRGRHAVVGVGWVPATRGTHRIEHGPAVAARGGNRRDRQGGLALVVGDHPPAELWFPNCGWRDS
jgi:D-glycero-D-manno-heptose 1,7-bisphosphate phosphatase